MFFSHWWQGIVFGFFTTVAMLIIAFPFTIMWKKYEETPSKPSLDQHNSHH